MSAVIPEEMLHKFVMPNGKHQGVRLVRVPVGYLRWMASSGHQYGDHAVSELRRRGVEIPNFDLTGHAIDRFSQRALETWIVARHKGEGIHAFMVRTCNEALSRLEADVADQYEFELRAHGLRWCFRKDGEWPVLMTVKSA